MRFRPALSRLRRTAVLALAVVAGVGVTAPRGWAQGRAGADPVPAGASATRAALTASLAAAERRGDRATAAVVRRRLTEGDLGPGDRLSVTLALDTIARYEFVVRDSQRVDVPPLGSLSLRGVLRSELQPAFVRFYERYYRNPDVRVQSLIRVGFLGAVQKPGYYAVPPDAPVTEAFTANAGGPSGNADLGRIEVRRATQRLYDRKGYERVARDGLTFDEAGLRSGDEIRVAERRQRNTVQVVQTVVFAITALTSLVFLIRTAYDN